MPRSLADRLWANVDKSGGPEACWPWTKYRNGQGYGMIGVADHKTERTHRVAWVVARGKIAPETPCVLHRCDNPPCCNPSHLRLGTHGQNMAEMKERGRTNAHLRRGDRNGSRKHPERRPRGDVHWTRTRPGDVPRGEDNAAAKLDEGKVREIRFRHAAGGTYRGLGREFGVTGTMVRAIVQRRAWTHVA
jgi:hypothetical protein